MKSLDPFILPLFYDISNDSRINDKSRLTYNSIQFGLSPFLFIDIKMKGSGVEGTAFDHNPSIHFDNLMKLCNQIDIIA